MLVKTSSAVKSSWGWTGRPVSADILSELVASLKLRAGLNWSWHELVNQQPAVSKLSLSCFIQVFKVVWDNAFLVRPTVGGASLAESDRWCGGMRGKAHVRQGVGDRRA